MSANQVIGSLRVHLGLDSAQFETGMKDAKGKADKFGLNLSNGMSGALKDIEARLYGASRSAGVAGNALASMGVLGAAAGAGLVAAFAATRSAMVFADEIGDTASKLAVTTDALQEYRFAVHALGGDYKDADAALEGFSKTFGAAHAGLSAKAAKPFIALGLNPQDFKSTEEALQAVIKKISGLKSAAEQAAIADKLGLSAMLPAVRAGADEIDNLRRSAHELGYVMDADLVEKAGSANDQFENLTNVLDVKFKSAMVNAVPLVMGVTGALVSGVEATNDLLESLKGLANWFDKQSKTAWNGETVTNDRDRLFKSMAASGNARVQFPKATMSSIKSTFIKPAPKPPIAETVLTPAAGGAAKNSAAQRAEASAAAIYQAERDQLDAQQALTADIAKLAVMRKAEIDAATQRESARLKTAADEGKITQAAASSAIAMTAKAAADKKLLITRQTEEQLAAAALGREQDIGRARDEIARIEASLATDAATRNGIERKALADRQALETKALQQGLDQQVSREEITQAQRDEALAARSAVQLAERVQAERQATIALEAEANARAEDALQLQIDGLLMQADNAETSAERRELDRRILDLQQELERLKLQEVINATNAAPADKAMAAARLKLLETYQRSAKAKSLDAMNGAFNDAADAVDAMRRGFESNDWAGALNGLAGAISTLQKAFGEGGSIGGKIGAVSGVLGSIGSMIGGSTGSALSGAASGAMAGFQLGGPLGAVAGGVLGGLGSLFGSSKKKKAAKKAAAAQAAAEAAAAAKAEADQIRALEIAKMRAGGDETGAVAAERADALLGLSAAAQELKKQIWALEDAALDAAKAADLDAAAQAEAAELRKLEIAKMRAGGDVAGAMAAERADELIGLSAAAQGLKKEIWDLEAASDAAADAAEHAASIRALEIQLMRATGDEAGALAAEHADLLKTLSDQEQVVQKAIWAQEELAATQQAEAERAASMRSLEIQLMRAMGNEAGALAAEHADLLKTLSDQEQVVQKAIWAQEELATAQQAEAERAASLRALEIQLMRASGNEAGAVAAEHEDLLKTLSDQEQVVQKAIWAQEELAAAEQEAADVADALSAAIDRALGGVDAARDDVQSAYDAESSALKERADGLRSFAKGIRDFSASLDTQFGEGRDYDALVKDFRKALTSASLGDPEGQAKFQTAAEALLDASKDNASTREQYLRDIAKVKAGSDKVASVAERQASIADQQLERLDASVAGILAVNSSVQSVEQALRDLQSALAAYATLSGQKLGANPSANAALTAATGYKGDYGSGGFQAWIVNQDETTKAAARRILNQYGQGYRISGFKTGGSFEVGGYGGLDSQLVQMRMTPGEIGHVSKVDSMGAMAAGVADLGARLEASNRRLEQVIINTSITARTLERFKGDGLYVRGQDPDAPLVVEVA